MGCATVYFIIIIYLFIYFKKVLVSRSNVATAWVDYNSVNSASCTMQQLSVAIFFLLKNNSTKQNKHLFNLLFSHNIALHAGLFCTSFVNKTLHDLTT